MNKALIITNPQWDFIFGSLAIQEAEIKMQKLASYIKTHGNEYAYILVTIDWHPYNHISFGDYGGDLPSHCIQYTIGSTIYQPLLDVLYSFNTYILEKGRSETEDESSILDSDFRYTVLNMLRYSDVDICGISAEYCVYDTALDLRLANKAVNVLMDYTVFINPDKVETFVKNVQEAQVECITL